MRDSLYDHPLYTHSESENIPTLDNFKKLSEEEVRTIIKTEFLIISPRHKMKVRDNLKLNIGSSLITPSSSAGE